MSLSDKAKEKQFFVIDQIVLENPKTKEFVAVLKGLEAKLSVEGGSAFGGKNLGKKQMLILPRKDAKLVRATSNLQSVNTVLANSLNLVDVITANSIIALKDSLPVIEKVYLKKSK